MTSLTHRRCLHHGDREAVARCPECKRFFCRECICEHDNRILCAACLAKLAAPPPRRRIRGLDGIFLAVQSALAVTVIWFFFFLVGRSLLAIPASFHDGTAWQTEESK